MKFFNHLHIAISTFFVFIITIKAEIIIEQLRSQSILYGISSIASDLNDTSIKCSVDLNILFDSVNQYDEWAIKGKAKLIEARLII